MSVIEAASAGVKDMADGSLRITLEFTPLVAKEAYALFGARGTPIAVCALKEGYAQAKDEPKPEPKEKPGPLCILACQWCQDEKFQEWVYFALENDAEDNLFDQTEDGAKGFILLRCGIESRKQLDTNPEAAEKFQRLIRGPFMKWMEDK